MIKNAQLSVFLFLLFSKEIHGRRANRFYAIYNKESYYSFPEDKIIYQS